MQAGLPMLGSPAQVNMVVGLHFANPIYKTIPKIL